MAAFRFALEPLLTVRRRKERSAQRKVAELEQERRSIEDRIRRKQEALSSGQQELRGELTGVITVASLRDHAGSALRLMRDAQREVLELAGVHRRLETARAALREATRDRRAVERLRQRRHEAWRTALMRKEAVALDEFAVIAAARKEPAR